MAGQNKYNKSNNRSNNKGGNDNRNNNRGNNNRGGNDNRNRNNDNRNQSNKPAGQDKPQSTSKSESSNDLLIFIVFLVGLALFFLVKTFYLPPTPQPFYGNTTNIKFMKEGKLSFRDAQTNNIIVDIFIEVAKSEQEIAQGLMYRKSLPANGGMLFVFDVEKVQSFWMKNTFLSLDIIFLDADKEIIKIHKNAVSLSEEPITSDAKAKYVVEVLSGLTDAYEIHIGDRVSFNY